MSTGGSPTSTDDFTNQLAPLGDSGPNFPDLKAAFNRALEDSQPYVDQCRLNYQTRFALWSGQSADGKKHAREGAKIDPTPWDGASDLRIFLCDDVIRKKTAMQCMALAKAQVTAKPVEGNDIKRAKVVSLFLKWLMRTQIPDLEREEELLANYLNEKGIAITGQFWEEKEQKTLKTVRLTELQAQFPKVNWTEMIQSPELADELTALFEELYAASAKKAKRMLAELRQTGVTSVPMVGKVKSYPVIRAFNLDNDIFVQGSATDLENAAGIWRVQYFSPEQLRSFVRTDGWDADWVDCAIEKAKGQLITLTTPTENQPMARNFVYTQQRHSDLVGVVYGYQRLSDEEGIPGIYLTVFNPMLPPEPGKHDGYAKFGLLDYSHGEYPFVLHRREYLSRRIHDSRGIPEPGKPWQDQIKAHRDSRIDAASMRIIPPLFYPIGRAPTRWGPGARIPERRPGEYHYGEGPPVDPVTDDSEDRLMDSFKEYNGLGPTKEGDATITPFENQFEVKKFLANWAKAADQVWKLYKQFGSETVYFRVVGLQSADPIEFKKGNEDEEFDITLDYDIAAQDFEQQTEKFKLLVQVAQLDRSGTVNWDAMMQVGMDMIDPNIAESVLQPASLGTQQVIEDQMSDLTKIAAGFNVNLKQGTPPNLAQQVLQNYAQAPDVRQRYMADKPFADRINAYAKQIQFRAEQQKNAQIGRMGSMMPGPTLQ